MTSSYDELSCRDQQVIELYLDPLAVGEHPSIFSCVKGLIGMASGHLRAGNVAYVLYGGESIYVLKSAPDKGHRTLVGEGDIRWCMELDEIPADVRYDDEVFILG